MSSGLRIPVNGFAAGPAPRVLVADDDPISCRFLTDGLRALGASTVACSRGLHALELARAEAFDLLLLDCHMPDAGALAIVGALRADAQAASGASVVVASSAAFAPGERHALIAAGCNGTLDKPCTLAGLRQILELIPGADAAPGVLDDAAAWRCCGDQATLDALRQLLCDELTALEQQLDALGDEPVGLGERLHRLRAACGFCGTTQLAGAAQALQDELLRRDVDGAVLARFRGKLQETLQTLRARGSAPGAGHRQHVP